MDVPVLDLQSILPVQAVLRVAVSNLRPAGFFCSSGSGRLGGGSLANDVNRAQME
jgi:hypothetical protein